MTKRKPTEAEIARKCGVTFKHIHFGMFDFSIAYVTGPKEGGRKFAEWKHECPHDAAPNARGICYWRPDYVPVVWVPRLPKTPREYGTLAHEMLHAVGWLSKWAGFRLDNDSEETFCHALGFAMTEALAT